MERVPVDGETVKRNTLHAFVARTAANYSVLLTGALVGGVLTGLVEAALCDGAALGLPDAMVAGGLLVW